MNKASHFELATRFARHSLSFNDIGPDREESGASIASCHYIYFT